VIHISVDGLRGDLLEELLNEDADRATKQFPNFTRLVTEGSATFNARTDVLWTNTLPNHTAMLTGRPVWPGLFQPLTVHHGWAANSTPRPGSTLHNSGNPRLEYVASVFDVAHDHGLSTALYASKTKFVIYEQSYGPATGAPDSTGPDDGRDKIDAYENNGNAAELVASFVSRMREEPFRYSFLHIRDPDSTGHANGWGSPQWNRAVAGADRYLGEILALIDESDKLRGETALILTADHGGIGRNHALPWQAENYTIPFFVWGAGFPAGGDLYDVFSEIRTAPGAAQPWYVNCRQPIRNGESGNLALFLLDLEPIPGSSLGKDHFPEFRPAPPSNRLTRIWREFVCEWIDLLNL